MSDQLAAMMKSSSLQPTGSSSDAASLLSRILGGLGSNNHSSNSSSNNSNLDQGPTVPQPVASMQQNNASLGSFASYQPPAQSSSGSSNLLPLLQVLNGTNQQQPNAVQSQPQPMQPPAQAPFSQQDPTSSSSVDLKQLILQLLTQSSGINNGSQTSTHQQQPSSVVAPLPPPSQPTPPSQQADQNQLIASLLKILSQNQQDQNQPQTQGQPSQTPSMAAPKPESQVQAQAQTPAYGQPPTQQTQNAQLRDTSPPPSQPEQTDVARVLLQLLSSQRYNQRPAAVSDYSVSSNTTRSMTSSDDWSSDSASRSNSSNSAARPVQAEVLGPHDVLLGRGSGISNHVGNIKFRKLVQKHKPRYMAASRVDKPKVASELVAIWRKLDPPGRFLARSESNSAYPWTDVGDHRARQKTSQCLRERERGLLKEQERKRKRIANL